MEAFDPKSSATATSSRLQGDNEAARYHCTQCGGYIGPRSKISDIDKFDRVYCSSQCYQKAREHPSWEYEARGGDY